MASKVLAACVSCGNFIEESDVSGFVAQGGRCATCQGLRRLAGKFGSLLVQGVTTQRELAELKREFYQLYKIDQELEQRKAEFMRKAQEEMARVVQEVEAQVGTPLKQLRDRKKQLEAQLQTFMSESKTADMVVRDLLVELRDTVVNRGNMPQYKTIVEDLRQILKWSEEEMETFVKAHYSEPVTAPVMTVKPLPPGRRQTPPISASPGKPVAKRAAEEKEKVEFKQVDGHLFAQAIGQMKKNTHVLHQYTPEEYDTMRCFLNTHGNVGYCITPENDLVSVFNASGVRGAGMDAVKDALNKGAETLDAFDGFLPNYYKQFGFEEFDRTKFDPAQKPKVWDVEQHGKPDVVFMRHEREKGASVAAYVTDELHLPRMAYIQDSFLRTGSKLLKIETPEAVFILTGSRVREAGLLNMLSLQMNTKASLKVSDVEQLNDGTMHVLVEGKFAFDPNTLRAFLAERLEGYEITATFYDNPTKAAVELKPVDKIAADPMASAMSYFNTMFETLTSLIGLERQRSNMAQMLLGQTTGAAGASQVQRPDNNDDLALKWERANVGGDSFGAGTYADGGLMGPNDRPSATNG
jgi:hypothetical protein